MRRFICLAVFLLCLAGQGIPQVGAQGTLDDIRKRLGKDRTEDDGDESGKSFYDIRRVAPTQLGRWITRDARGETKDLHGIEAQIRVNSSGKDLLVPVALCYFYDKNKNLMEKRKADFVRGLEAGRQDQPLKGDLVIDGKRRVSIIFTYPSGFNFKYAVVVVGDSQQVAVDTYPGSAKFDDFDFDEKHLVPR